MADATTSSVIPLGLGCLSLIPKLDAETIGKRGDDEWWQKALESGLGALSSITDLEVNIRHIYALQDLYSASLPDDFEDGQDSYRNFDLELYGMPSKTSYVKFVVTIPKRMHAELIGFRMPEGAERIEFRTVYGFRGPVTFIRPLGPDDREGGSNRYIVLMREFLKRELSRNNSPIRVASIGPSPFHADMEVRPSTTTTSEFNHTWQKADYGYDLVKFFYNPDQSASEDAYNSVIDALVDPFATYYFLVRAKYRRMDRAREVSEMASELISVHRREGMHFAPARRRLVARTRRNRGRDHSRPTSTRPTRRETERCPRGYGLMVKKE